MTTVMRKIGLTAAVVLASTMMLAGCAPDPIFDSPAAPNSQEQSPSDNSSTPGSEPSAPAESTTPAAPPEAIPPAQEESCGWDSPRLTSGSAKVPSGQSGDLASALIGAWQHTHIDGGTGYEAFDSGKDIRFVFPSSTRMVYCQTVVGATNQAETAVDLTINGMELELGSSGVSYGVVAWDANTMLWKNHLDGSMYLLQRR